MNFTIHKNAAANLHHCNNCTKYNELGKYTKLRSAFLNRIRKHNTFAKDKCDELDFCSRLKLVRPDSTQNIIKI